MSRQAVFLDRDGVINRALIRDGKPYPPAKVGELELVPQARESLERLQAAGFLLLVVTNQPDVGRGTADVQSVDAIHRALSHELPIDAFFVCPHDDGDRCDCRKPLAGLLRQGADRFDIDLSSSFMVGDRWRDVEAGQAAGCRTVWIDCKYNERGPARAPDTTVASLPEAVDWILNQTPIEVKRTTD